MDGTKKDSFVSGKLFRPASLRQAVEEYPDVVSYIICSGNTGFCLSESDGNLFYIVRDVGAKVPKEDFDKLLNVAGVVRFFPYESHESKMSRIRSCIAVEFSDRSEF
jgi:arginyl-tRNA synthetase